MNFRSWLKRSFLRRGLRRLSQTALQRLLVSLRLPSLYPVFDRILSLSEDGVPGGSSDEQLQRDTRQLRVVCDERIRLDMDYVGRTAPVRLLPAKVTAAQLKTEIQSLAEGEFFFPGNAYLDAVPNVRGREVTLVHRCRAQPTVTIAPNNPLNPVLPTTVLEPTVFLIYNSPLKRPAAAPYFQLNPQTNLGTRSKRRHHGKLERLTENREH